MSLDLATIGIEMRTDGLEKGTKALKDTENAANKTADSADNLSDKFGGANKATDTLIKSVKLLAASYAAVKLGGLIKESAMLAARYETMGVVMRIAGNNAGYTMAQMEGMSKTLQKSGISMLQSRDALTQLATANVDLAHATALGRAAQDLAVVGNTNSSDAMGRLIHGIKSGQVEILRTIGLNVSFEGSYKKLAAQLGVNSNSLTEQQKTLARTNAVVLEAARYNGIYEESMTTAGKAMGSLTRHWENFKVQAGDAFLPVLATFVFKLTDALKDMNSVMEKSGQATAGVGAVLNGALRVALETVAVLGANVVFVFKGVGREIGAIAAQAAAVARFDFAGAAAIGEMVRKDGEVARAALDAFEKKMLGVAATKKAVATMSEAERIAAGQASAAAAAAEDKAAKAASGRADAAKKAATEYERAVKQARDFILSLKEQTQEVGLSAEQVKMLAAAKAAALAPTAALRMEIMKQALALNITTKAQGDAVEADENRIKATEALLKKLDDEVIALDDIAKAYNEAEAAARAFLDTTNKQYARTLAGIGQGTQTRDRNAGMAQIEDKYSQQGLTLESDRRRGAISGEQYQAELDRIKRFQFEAVASYNAYYDALIAKQGDWSLGASEALNNYANQAKNVFQQTEDLVTKAFKGMEDALVNFVMTGKLNFADFAKSIIADIIRIQARSMSAGIGNAIFGAVAGAFGGGFGAGAAGAVAGGSLGTTAFSEQSLMLAAQVRHQGGDVGAAGPSRQVPASIFANAQRFHSGGVIGADEVPIIAQRGERVLTKEQQRQGGGAPSAPPMTFNISMPGIKDSREAKQASGTVQRSVLAAINQSQRYR